MVLFGCASIQVPCSIPARQLTAVRGQLAGSIRQPSPAFPCKHATVSLFLGPVHKTKGPSSPRLKYQLPTHIIYTHRPRKPPSRSLAHDPTTPHPTKRPSSASRSLASPRLHPIVACYYQSVVTPYSGRMLTVLVAAPIVMLRPLLANNVSAATRQNGSKSAAPHLHRCCRLAMPRQLAARPYSNGRNHHRPDSAHLAARSSMLFDAKNTLVCISLRQNAQYSSSCTQVSVHKCRGAATPPSYLARQLAPT